MRSAERKKVNVLAKCLRSLVGVSRMDRVKNDTLSSWKIKGVDG